MTISSTVKQSGPYAGTGTTDTFAYTFRILSKNDIEVIETDSFGAETILVVDTDFSVTGVGDAAGNVVRTAGNLPTNFTWIINRLTPLTQLIDFISQGSFLPQTHEDGLDKLTMILQEFDDALDRSIKSRTAEVTIDLLLPLVAARAGMLLEFDSAGLPNVGINAAAAAAAIATALASGTAVTLNAYTGDGSTTAFALSVAPAAANGMLVSVDGLVQRPVTDFTIAGTTLTFTTAPPNNSKIVLRNFGNAVAIIQVNQRGILTLASSGTGVVTLPVVAPDANYVVTLTPDANEGVWVSGKSTTQFTINSSNSSSTADVNWMVSH